MNFFKIVIFVLLIVNINAKDLNPSYTLTASGSVTDLLLKDKLLYASTTASAIDIFDIKTRKKTNTIKVPKIKDFLGDIIDSKIYSIDLLNDKLLILSQGQKGGRNIDILENGKKTNIITDKKRLFIAKAKFVEKDRIIYALLSNQLFLYDIKNNKIIKDIQISHSKFSNFKLSEDKKYIVTADESGIVKMYDTTTLKELKSFSSQNVDNIFQLDLKNNIIITAGQDRRCAVYDIKKNSSYYKKAEFLIYSVGLSPSGNIGVMADNEQSDLKVFNTKTKEDLFILKENKALISNILFLNEKELFVASEEEHINNYKLKD